MRVGVIGGSIGGLTTALVLADLGCDVDVFERAPVELEGRGAGIVLQPDTIRWFESRSHTSVADLSTEASRLRYLAPNGGVEYDEPGRYQFTSWNAIYRPLLQDLGLERYHLAEHFVGLSQTADGVELRFVSGRTERVDLAVFADGISSTGRRRLLPEVAPLYSGYLGWRGTVDEDQLTASTRELIDDCLCYALTTDGHMNLYPIPGRTGAVVPGRRRWNFVWYRNQSEGPELDELLTDKRGTYCAVSISPGLVQDSYVAELKRAARDQLPPAAAELVERSGEPFIQTVLDVQVPRMAFGRACLVGDAAFAARPHAAAGTAKAAADAWTLAAALSRTDGDVPAALRSWEAGQLALGRQLVARVQQMGRRSQFDGTWKPGDRSLLFGLYGAGR